MKKLLTFIIFLAVTLALAGCDYLDLDPEIIDQIKDITDDYCEENPDNEYCNLDFEEEIEKAEMKFAEYFEDYSNSEYTNQDIADMYFDGMLPEGFEEERAADLEAGTVLSLDAITFRLDGGFTVSFYATTGDDMVLRKRPGRVKYSDVTLERASIEWYDGVDNDCDDDCDGLEDMDTTKETIMKYFEDYTNAEVTNQEIADMYYGGVLTDEFVMQREKDLEDGLVLTLVEVLERELDSFFDITYEVSRQGDDPLVRKRPGRTVYKNGSSLIIWETIDEDCDGVDDDCN